MWGWVIIFGMWECGVFICIGDEKGKWLLWKGSILEGKGMRIEENGVMLFDVIEGRMSFLITTFHIMCDGMKA